MTNNERAKAKEILRNAVAESSQAEVARRIGRSAAAVNQVLKGVYAGNTDAVLERVDAEYGGAETDCPVMGRIALSLCIENRTRAFRPTNHQRVKLWKECRGCANNPELKTRGGV